MNELYGLWQHLRHLAPRSVCGKIHALLIHLEIRARASSTRVMTLIALPAVLVTLPEHVFPTCLSSAMSSACDCRYRLVADESGTALAVVGLSCQWAWSLKNNQRVEAA